MVACHGAALISLMTFLPIYLRVVHGTASGRIGLLLLPMTAGVGLGSLLTGWMVSKTGRTMIFPSLGLIVVAATLSALGIWSPYLDAVQFALLLGLAACSWAR